MDAKPGLRAKLRARRRDHVTALPEKTRALVFLRPPAPVAEMLPADATVGLYYPTPLEAPTRGYAKWLTENGRTIALPSFADRNSPMVFRRWADPYDDGDLTVGPFGVLQPEGSVAEIVPQVVFVPLLGFTPRGDRLGQGAGHYDRWLADHPDALAIGLAWDCQCIAALPVEAHDRPLSAIVTPTRIYRGES